jgi:hypothetical protein
MIALRKDVEVRELQHLHPRYLSVLELHLDTTETTLECHETSRQLVPTLVEPDEPMLEQRPLNIVQLVGWDVLVHSELGHAHSPKN